MYTPATQLPALKLFQWSTPSNPNPRLASAIDATTTTLQFTSAPLDYDGVTPITGNFLMGIKNENSYVETVYVPVGAISGTTATGVVRGVRLTGLDYTTGDASLASAANGDSPVFCNVSAVNYLLMVGAMQGTVASGGTTWKIGDGTDSDVTVEAYNADVNKPFWKYDKTTNQFVYSNDGVSSTPFGTGSGVTGGDGITVTAGDIDVDLTDTTIFVSTSSGAGDSGKVARLNASGVIPSGFKKDTLVNQVTGVTTVTGATVETALASVSANVTGANLNKITTNVDNVSTISQLVQDTGTANAFAITYTIPSISSYVKGGRFIFQALNTNTNASTLNVSTIGALPIKKKHDTALAAGDIEAGQIVDCIIAGSSLNAILIDSYSESNVNNYDNIYGSSVSKVGQTFTPTQDGLISSAKFYLKKTGSPTGNATFSIFATSGGVPTGAALATSDTLNVATLTTSGVLYELSFTGTNIINLEKGVTYAVAVEYSGGDISNNIGAGFVNTGGGHSGQYCSYGGSWSVNANRDTAFYMYGGKFYFQMLSQIAN